MRGDEGARSRVVATLHARDELDETVAMALEQEQRRTFARWKAPVVARVHARGTEHLTTAGQHRIDETRIEQAQRGDRRGRACSTARRARVDRAAQRRAAEHELDERIA